MCRLHYTRLESVLKKGFHRVNNRLSTGFVKSHSNSIVIKRILNFTPHIIYVTIVSYHQAHYF